jgi:hypothetical protein
MSQLGRIGGPVLSENLLRDGNDLAFETDLLYLSVEDLASPSKTVGIGIKTDAPNRTLTIDGTTNVPNLLVTTQADVADLTFLTYKIKNLTGNIIISPDQSVNPVVVTNELQTSKLTLVNSAISTLLSNDNIELTANGTGKVNFYSTKLDITGNLHSTGNITMDGNVIFGSDNADSVTVASDVSSDLMPNIDNTYTLGDSTKRWKTVYLENTSTDTLTSAGLTVNDIDMLLTQGNTLYVSINGADTNVGNHLHNTFKTIKAALASAVSGDNVVIFPGVYAEIFPLTVPKGVSVAGSSLRAVTIVPTPATQTNDCFLLNGETTVSNLTIKDFYAPGYGFRFAPNCIVTSRSPYVQNVSIITQEIPGTLSPIQITPGPAPTGVSLTSNSVTLSKNFYSQVLVDSLVGQTAVIDRYPNPPLYYTVVSIETEPLSPTEWRMTVDTTFNPAGQLRPVSFYPDVETTQIIANDIWDTTGNSVGEKWVAYYKTGLPPWFATVVGTDWTIDVAGTLYIVDYVIEDPVNPTMWRIYVTTSLVAGVGIPIFSSPTGTATISAGNGALIDGSEVGTTSNEASMLFHSVTMIVPLALAVHATNGARVEWLNSFTYFAEKGIYLTQGTLGFASQGVRFGAELRSIGSANVYGNYGAVADGADTLGYLVGHNFGYIGTGTNRDNDYGLVIQANEVVAINDGRLYYDSMDHKGDYRIGDIFYVNQATGKVAFNAQAINFAENGSIILEGPGGQTIINSSNVIVGQIRIYDNNIDSTSGPINLLAQSGITTLNTNVFVNGLLDITGDVNVDGNVILGDSPLDNVTVFPKLTQTIEPDITSTYSLGSGGVTPKLWRNLRLKLVNVDNVTQLTSNTLSTLTTNTDLEFVADGLKQVRITTTDVSITNDLTVNVDSLFGNTKFETDVLHVGDYLLTGNADRTGNTNITGNLTQLGNFTNQFENIQIFGNTISTTLLDSNLEFQTSGIGILKVLTSDVEVTNDLSVLGTGFLNVVDVDGTITADEFTTGNISIVDNYITTTAPNWDLELLANGTGQILIPLKDVNVDTNLTVDGILTVNGTSSLKFVEVTGITTLVGDINQTGNSDITGDVISSNITGYSYLQSSKIKIDANIISAIDTDANIEFAANGTGGVVLDSRLRITDNNISNVWIGATDNLQKSILLSPNGTGSTVVNVTSALRIPTGNNTNKTLTNLGEIRLNSTTLLFEGRVNGDNVPLKGIYDTDKNTYITAELTRGLNDNILRFVTNDLVKATISSTKLSVDNVFVDNIRLFENTINNRVLNDDLVFSPNGTGYIVGNNVSFSPNTIKNNTNSALTIASTGTGYIKFSGVGAVVIPTGPTDDRRLLPELGEIRHNTTLDYMEVYNGTTWIPAVGTLGAAPLGDVEDIMDFWALVLG